MEGISENLEEIVKSKEYRIDILRDILNFNLLRAIYEKDYEDLLKERIKEKIEKNYPKTSEEWSEILNKIGPNSGEEWSELSSGLFIIDYIKLLEQGKYLTNAGHRNVKDTFSLLDKNVYEKIKNMKGDMANIFFGDIFYSTYESVDGIERKILIRENKKSKDKKKSIIEIYFDNNVHLKESKKPGKKALTAFSTAFYGKGKIYSTKVGQTLTKKKIVEDDKTSYEFCLTGDIQEYGPFGGTRRWVFLFDIDNKIDFRYYFDEKTKLYLLMYTSDFDQNKRSIHNTFIVPKELMYKLANNEIERYQKPPTFWQKTLDWIGQ